nr:hypothetical protein [Microctonus hyperodae filamentous virus]
MILLQREEVVSRRDDDAFIQLTFFDNQSLFVHENSGFFNATKLCKNVKKNLFHFIRLDKYRELEKHFTLLFGTIAFGTREYEYSDAETFSGTYMHPVLLLAVAMWCSPKMYVEAALVVMDYFNNGGETRKRMMKEKLFPKNFDPRETVNEVTYAGCSILIDPVTRWFNASKFCTTHGKRLGYFERTDNIKETLSYLTKLLDKKVSYHKDGDKAAPNYGTYYHPIMFLRLASWISVDFYLKAAMITCNYLFGGSDIESNHIEDTNISLDIEDVREMLERDSELANFVKLTKVSNR